MLVLPLRKQFSVIDYRRMYESGILTEDERVELLDGEIYQMSPLGPLHIVLINRLAKLLMTLVGDAAIVSVQNAIQLDDYSEPQPDIAIVAPYVDSYEDELPRPTDVLLLIEVADTSLHYDREEKLPRYATAQIGEVWIIDAKSQVIEQYSQPIGDQYTQLHRCLKGQHIQSLALPTIAFTTDRIFRS
jgi:Uma2 family endonuclease